MKNGELGSPNGIHDYSRLEVKSTRLIFNAEARLISLRTETAFFSLGTRGTNRNVTGFYFSSSIIIFFGY